MLALICLSLMLSISGADIQEGGFVNELEDIEEDFEFNHYTQQWLETCEMNNGTQASEDIETALSTLTQCVTSRINIFDIAEKIKEATPKGDLDEVFTSYCNLIPEVKDCRAPMISALQVCLSDQGDEDLETIDSAIDGALDFMCFKGGERIAIFLAENGTECVTANSERIASCLNDSMPQIESLLQDLMVLNQSLFDSNNCWLETRIKECVIDNLQTCSDPTPANVIEGLIDSMIYRTPCHRSTASCLSISWTTLFLILFTLCHAKSF